MGLVTWIGLLWDSRQTGVDSQIEVNLAWRVEQKDQEAQGLVKEPVKLKQGKRQRLRRADGDSSMSNSSVSISTLPGQPCPRPFPTSLRDQGDQSPQDNQVPSWASDFTSGEGFFPLFLLLLQPVLNSAQIPAEGSFATQPC